MRGVVLSDDNDSQESSLGFQLSEEEIKEDKIKKSPPPDPIEIKLQKIQDEEASKELYNKELGFTRVIELLMKFKNPIIGHNMIYDLGFIYR